MAKKKKGKKGKGKKVRVCWAALPQFGARRCVAPAGGWVVGFLWGAGGDEKGCFEHGTSGKLYFGQRTCGEGLAFWVAGGCFAVAVLCG